MGETGELFAAMYNFAKRVAHRMLPKDPMESDSIAGEAVVRAFRTWDPAKGAPLKRWVALIVKRDVWGHWRLKAKRKETQSVWLEKSVTFLDHTKVTHAEPEEVRRHGSIKELVLEPPFDSELLSPYDWQLLCESHVQGLSLDVIRERRFGGISRNYMRKLLRDAEERLFAVLKEARAQR